MELNWRKVEAGHYESTDGRFDIMKSYDCVFGNHWELHDSFEKDWYKSRYHEYSLKECQAKAETLVKNSVC